MAAALGRCWLRRSLRGVGAPLGAQGPRGLLLRRPVAPGPQGPPRAALTTSNGAILPKPDKMSFGLMKVMVVVVPFLYLGTQISKSFASVLEEHDIFVPVDDDDDD
ncbi:single-pass membrane protein with aspartate-rich tail 1b [Callorhinchus milii]|uniref:Essential MCU regulator, mitochondrial n=2 Tax=Callorhinchus milii TaxID=7868 RepID=A0A4W3GZI8_CALMI|nr:single-pass membrane protein with aspartate-rich tail 1b [Callorhinchus milii]|eukprot:gi/632989827/ref/XP_007883856.1/ PREDICTED: essential MCU regulator, mitochondrial [Callorhinchus milii]